MDYSFLKNINNFIPFSKKEKTKKFEEFFKYFKIENSEDGLHIEADITDDDIRTWLFTVTHYIQKSFSKFPIIKNYLAGDFILGGQKIEFAFVKDFKEGPHAMRMKVEEENEELYDLLESINNQYNTKGVISDFTLTTIRMMLKDKDNEKTTF